ncbi:MAG: SoxR reducing system RseC family protein [Candidatus Woesearchaeota archaeon]
MKKAKLHSKDHNRTYLSVHHKNLQTHKHIFPGRKRTKLLPVVRKKHHEIIKEGSNVHFEINDRNNSFVLFFYYGSPLFLTIIGFIIATFITTNVFQILIIIVLSSIFGFFVKNIIKKHFDVFREINVKIHLPSNAIKVYKARKKK